MKNDDNNPDEGSTIDPQLEARVVAWVSGEASAFEIAELERLIGGNPELAIFKQRIEAVRGLVVEAIRPDNDPLVMSPERRAKLLQAISGTDKNTATGAGSTVVPPASTSRARRTDRRWFYAIAASLAIGAFSLFTFSSLQKHAVTEMRLGNSADKSLTSPEHRDARLDEFKAAISSAGAREEVRRQAIADAQQRAARRAPAAKGRDTSNDYISTANNPDDVAVSLPQPGGPGAVNSYAYDAPVTPPAVADDKVVQLSPFTVNAPSDQGYAAASTLAGNRLRTELKDVASSVTVVTDQFLKDTGTTSEQEKPLTYSGNSTETGGAQGNFAGGKNDGNVAQLQSPSPNQANQANVAQAQQNEENAKTLKLSSFSVHGSALVAEGNSLKKEKQLESPGDADLPLPARPKTDPTDRETPEVKASQQPVSTFSLHVSDVSFRLARAAVARNESIDPQSIRPEEFYNAFDFGDPVPAMSDKVSCRIEQSAHPFRQQRNLVRIAIKVPATGRNASQPLRLTVLLDTSGSMEREDRVAIARRAMGALTSLLGPNDRLTLIGFARRPRLLAESVSGDQAAQVLDIMAHTPAEGGTNLEEALKLGGELARRQMTPTAQNRIVLLTDGAANLGNANPEQLAASIEALRQQGIAFDACGVGLDGLDDAVLEQITRKGSGRYYVLNAPDEADAGFARQLAGAFHPAAENVKLQVRFNPARVGSYRLIGFEKHRLREEDFRNDNIAAAALAAEEAAVAVYQVEPLPQGEGELGEVYVRFRDTAAGTMVERSWTLSYDAHASAFDQATPSMQLAGTAALLAEKLRGDKAGEAIKLGELTPVVNKLHNHYAGDQRVQELVTLFEQMRRLAGE